MVDIRNAVHVPHRGDHGRVVDIRRAAQHQCPDRAADLGQCEIQYVQRDSDGGCGIDPAQVVENDQRAADDHGDRGERIREFVQEERADVHAALLHGPGERRSQNVDHERHAAEDHDGPTLNLERIDNAHTALVDQINADEDECRVVDQCSDNLDPAASEGHPLVRRPPRDLARRESDHQRRHIREVVQLIRDLRDGQKGVRWLCCTNGLRGFIV